ncbi:hypothetical protein [Pseudomonas sp. zfem002]|uniref:HNH endonuclease n=1 Tax=Pseudomonas sp. zfem002 TaxID=3078197 RepID=UPI002927F74D|nr:hypothetical protein [Pseudomonas sp. zfem002]MDU9393536.1 hypothetical protein [Pseudomonas sp. zfem002]
MSKYAPFADFLRSQTADAIEITFAELAALVNGLPASAWNHGAWWANSSLGDSHTWAHQWAAAGWKCISADRERGVAIFQRLNESPVGRLPALELRKITSEHIWSAVQALLEGATAEGFAPSTDYDLIVDGGVRLAPKQVFGLAATSALGLHITPAHFTAGRDTVCFELLEEAGYRIVPKDECVPVPDLSIEAEELQWAEGNPRLVTHLRKERSPGLAKAKKAAFIRQYGRLYCESCQLDPAHTYGEHGTACIEVHHYKTQVAQMEKGHSTSLDDLRCLCANCHRVEHRRLRQLDPV